MESVFALALIKSWPVELKELFELDHSKVPSYLQGLYYGFLDFHSIKRQSQRLLEQQQYALVFSQHRPVDMSIIYLDISFVSLNIILVEEFRSVYLALVVL